MIITYYSYKDTLLTLLIVGVYSIYLIHKYEKLGCLFTLFIIIAFTNTQIKMPKAISNENSYKVIDVYENYYIIKGKTEKIALYTKASLNFDDQISFEAKLSKINIIKTIADNSFEKRLRNNNIIYSAKSNNVKILKAGKSFKSKLNNHINNHPNNAYLKKLFLNINYTTSDNNINYIILSSGIIIRDLIKSIKRFLALFLYKSYVLVIELCLLLIYLILFKNFEFTISLLFHKVISLTKLSRLDKISLSSIIILYVFPYYVFSLSFQITLIFRLVSYIKISKNNYFLKFLILIPFQLKHFYVCNLFEIVFFSYNRAINLIAYLLGIIDIVFFCSLSESFLTKFIISNDNFIITGNMRFLLLFIWIIVSLKLLQKFKVRYLISLILLLYINQNQLLFNPNLIFTQLYVGQGDAAIIKYPNKNKVLLLDTGSKYNYQKLKSHLDYYGIKTIDAIIITHYDEDHAGNLEKLEDDFKVKKIIDKAQTYDFYKLKIYMHQYLEEIDNDNSIITYFKINDFTYLSLADVSKSIEERFLSEYPSLDYNIIKLSHHGSDTSTSSKLLKKENLHLVINSSGYQNMYNHPNQNVLKRISEFNLPFLDTQDVGDISIYHSFNNNYLILP